MTIMYAYLVRLRTTHQHDVMEEEKDQGATYIPSWVVTAGGCSVRLRWGMELEYVHARISISLRVIDIAGLTQVYM